MGDVHLYLKSHVLILADVFETFRKTGKEYYNLEPAHYFSSPGSAWDATLQMTYINLELITDIDMYQMEETGLFRKIAVCFLWLLLPGDYRVTDEALLAETT